MWNAPAACITLLDSDHVFICSGEGERLGSWAVGRLEGWEVGKRTCVPVGLGSWLGDLDVGDLPGAPAPSSRPSHARPHSLASAWPPGKPARPPPPAFPNILATPPLMTMMGFYRWVPAHTPHTLTFLTTHPPGGFSACHRPWAIAMCPWMLLTPNPTAMAINDLKEVRATRARARV